jgi:hypothetical protein
MRAVCGPCVARTVRPALCCGRHVGQLMPVDLRFWVGAGEGNRTLMTSLEGWGSAIELRPRVRRETRSPPAEHRQRTRKKAGRRNAMPGDGQPLRYPRRAFGARDDDRTRR